jgi:hypothetical protein
MLTWQFDCFLDRRAGVIASLRPDFFSSAQTVLPSGKCPAFSGSASRVSARLLRIPYFGRVEFSCRSALISYRVNGRAATGVVAMLVTLVVAGTACWILGAARDGKSPPLEDRGAWRWISNAPGATIYVREVPKQPSRDYATVWVAYRFPDSSVSVNADMTQLWELDCRQHASRRLGTPIRGYPTREATGDRDEDAIAPWRHDSSGTTTGKLFARVCADIG